MLSIAAAAAAAVAVARWPNFVALSKVRGVPFQSAQHKRLTPAGGN